MIRIPLGQVDGHKLTTGLFPYLGKADPYAQSVIVHYGTYTGIHTWESLKIEYGVEIYMTPEEAEMVERGRFTRRVLEDAKRLAASIDDWLWKEKSR